MTGSSTQGIKTVLHPVTDLAKAKPVYAALLGIQPQADSSYYVGFDAEGQHIGLVPGGAQAAGVPAMILPKVRDPRFVTIRRGGTLTDSDHRPA